MSLSLLSDGRTFIASGGGNAASGGGITSNYTVDSSGNILTGSLVNLSDALSSYLTYRYSDDSYNATSIIDVSTNTKPNSTTTNVRVSDSYNNKLNFT